MSTNIPHDPLLLRRLVTPDGQTPPGSIGWGYYWPDRGRLFVADARHVARFWPARYDAAEDRWVAICAGFEMRAGEVSQVFPV